MRTNNVIIRGSEVWVLYGSVLCEKIERLYAYGKIAPREKIPG